jgi:hypothetical protein
MGTPMSQLRGDLRPQDRFGMLVGWWANRPTTRRVRCSVMLARLLSDAEIACSSPAPESQWASSVCR